MLIVEVVTGQRPLEIVHCKILLVAVEIAVAVALGFVLVVIIALPANTDHVPEPTNGVLPDRIVELELAHNVCEIPALAIEGKLSRTMLTVDVVEGQTPFDIVH
jgi:hypothetical protein